MNDEILRNLNLYRKASIIDLSRIIESFAYYRNRLSNGLEKNA